MITTTFHSCVPKDFRPIFTDAIQLLSERLGLSAYDASIELHFILPEVKINPDRSIIINNGSMIPVVNEANESRVKRGLPPNQFEIEVVFQAAGIMLITLAHEMVHVKQWLTGELSVKKLRVVKDEDKVFYFNGAIIPSEAKDRPWEKEPTETMHELAAWVALKISAKQNDYLQAAGIPLTKQPEAAAPMH